MDLSFFRRPAGRSAKDAGSWLARVVSDPRSFVDAARFLIENGEEEAATELAANVWRLWITCRATLRAGGAFLAAVLQAGEGKPSRARALALYGD